MCGRFALATPQGDLVETFEVPPLDVPLAPRFNVAPTQDALVVAQDRQGRRMGLLRWGLPALREGDAARRLFNARGESAHRTPSFRAAFRQRRCLVPADGFYEWQARGGSKAPFYFRPAAGGVLGLGGIWDRGVAPGGAPWSGFVILTVEANDEVAPVHDRMPLLVDRRSWSAWLDPASPLEAVMELVTPAPAGVLVGHPVSRRVNRVTEDDEGLVAPV